MKITRKDIGYTIYSRLEESLRYWIASNLMSISENWSEFIPAGVTDKILDKTSSQSLDNINDPMELLEETNIPDLAEIVCFKGAYNKYISNAEINQKEFQTHMGDLYDLRNRIAHVRQSFTSLDLDRLIEIAEILLPILKEHGIELDVTIKCIKTNPEKVVIKIPNDFFLDQEIKYACPNNLPVSDYDPDGGFVGRINDIKKLKTLILGDLDRVITISGAGGVGKTALAHNFCRFLLGITPAPFDAIIWISAKEERLTLTGIEAIEPMVRNYEELLSKIMEVYGFCSSCNLSEKEEHVELILKATLNGLLLVVDNLETIQDERIIEFIKDIPRPNKVLITSRMGLGEVERRYPLKELSRGDSIALVRTLAQEKGIISLAKLPDNTINNYTQKMSNYPLVIKWVLGQVALGKDINLLIKDLATTSGDIAKFSFDHIYNNLLSDNARMVLCCLAASDEPMTRGVLVHISSLQTEELDKAIHDLTLASLVIPQQDKGENDSITTKYSLLGLTLGYLRGKLQSNPDLWRSIRVKLDAAGDRIEEANRAGKKYRYALEDLGAITDEEKIAATWALTAYQRAQIGDYAGSVEAYKRAVEISPNLPRVYRNWAVVESDSGYYARSQELMHKAVSLDKDDPTLWFTWGQLEKRQNNLDNSLKYFEKTLKLSPDDGAVIAALGDVARRKGEFEKANNLYEQALQFPPSESRSGRHEIINRTALVDNLRRWTEELIKIKNYALALDKAKETYNQANNLIQLPGSDERTRDTLQEAAFLLGKTLTIMDNTDAAIPYLRQGITDRPTRVRTKRATAWSCYYLAANLTKVGNKEEAKQYLKKGRRLILPKWDNLLDLYNTLIQNIDKPTGILVNVIKDKGFGFIKPDKDKESNVFVHISQIEPSVNNDEFKMMEGSRVSFIAKDTDKGPQAQSVTLLKVS